MSELKPVFVGKDWFPWVAGGLNRYFYGEVHSFGDSAPKIVSFVRESSPSPLRPMASEQSSLRERWRGSRREVRRALDEGCNLVHSHFALYTFPWLRDLPKNVPLVVLFHGPYAAELAAEATGTKGRLKAVAARAMERSVYRRAARVITLSKAFHDVATGYGVAEDRLRIIPGGVNTSPYLAASTTNLARAQMRWPLDRPILLTVRRLARRMGLEGLIDAMNIVRRAHPNVLLFIGGKGALAGALQARIDANGLSENVKLLGFIADDQLASAYAAADLMIVPTVALEGFGLVTVEALASGTPVLGTPVGGTPEILRSLNEDMLFASISSSDIAKKIIAVLSGEIVLPNAAQCRTHAMKFDWKLVAPQIEIVFQEALNGS